MKIRKGISFLLAVFLIMATPVYCFAEISGTDVLPETTEAATEPLPAGREGENLINSGLAFGSVSVISGCRTLDGMMPLAGSDRKAPTAQSVMIYERNTGTVIYAYNPDAKVPAGSLFKILTALLVIEHCPDLDAIVTVEPGIASRVPAGAQTIKLRSEEQLTVRDLLHCMILQSANDAAIALAEHVSGTQNAFITMMNERAAAIGCGNTLIGSVHGMGKSDQYSTARDMARIVMEATKNETFCELFAAQSYTVPETNLSDERKFASQNYLMETTIVPKYNDQNVTGGFASYSESLGASIVCTAKTKFKSRPNLDVVVVLLGATRQFNPEKTWQVLNYGNFDEVLDLLQYVYKNFKLCNVLYEGQALRQFQVADGESDVVGAPAENIDTILPMDVQMDNLVKNYSVANGGLAAPIKQDSVVATVEVWYRSSCLMEAQLHALSDVRTKEGSGLTIAHGVTSEKSEKSPVLFYITLGVMIPGVLYLGSNYYRRYRAIQRRRRREIQRRGY